MTNPESSPILTVDEINRFFGGLHAVADVSFTVPEHSITAVIGPNGAGKTTLFNLIAGTLPVSSGTVAFRGAPVTGLKPHQVAGLGILRTFQTLKLNGHMSVLDNVMLGCHTKSTAGFLAGLLSLPFTRREERETEERAREVLETLGIAELSEEEAGSLPFGKQRAVELARALAADPSLLLLDEPASGLNIHETEELSRLIGVIRDRGRTILLVEHDMSLVMDISDSIVVLNFGKKIAEGPPREIQRNPDVIAIYLGDDYA